MYYMQKKMNRKWTIILTVLSATVLFVSCSGENGKAMNKTAANSDFGQLFKVNVQTDGSGKVSLISVTVYDSLELMCGDICLDLRLHTERGGYFKYKKEKEDVLIDFL